ncbi:MAG: hypothetical protein OXE17_06830 [Chloroflexi bacterium]|nr:hypothetical protein [Chloroflexota bacterium]
MIQGTTVIREGARRDIVDLILLRGVPFHGRLNCMDFLKRVWPLEEMPSEDHRFRTATGDIATHIGFRDWDDSHLLLERLKLARGPDEEFLRFIEEVVHPLVVPDETEVLSLVAAINGPLGREGYHLVETDRISGKTVYGAKPVTFVRADPDPTPWEKVDRQANAMREQLTLALSHGAAEEGYQVVGHLGREVMISLAQAVIDPSEAIGEDGKRPSETDAVRLLDAYIGRTLPGSGHEALRRAVRGVVQATSAVLHVRSATYKDALLAVELVSATVHLTHILANYP